jgi:ABC-2 type transport system ATP-binding protein
METYPIEAQHLRRSYRENRAVDDVSLRVATGEIYGLVGPDGAGKTTTLRLLVGALRPTHPAHGQPAAVIRVGGFDVLRQAEKARSQVGYLAQRFSLYEDLTVMENIRFFAEVRGILAEEWRPRCLNILEFVGLSAFGDRRAGQLSGGMKQKLGLAAALVHQPRILLLDEPTTGVDPVTRQDFWQLLIRLAGGAEAGNLAGRPAVLVSTPYMDEAARCGRIGFMRQGRLIAEGTPAELRAELEGRVVELVGGPLRPLRALTQADSDVQDVQMFGDRLHLRVRPDQGAAVIARLAPQAVAAGLRVDRIRLIPAQLEDVFMSLSEVPV